MKENKIQISIGSLCINLLVLLITDKNSLHFNVVLKVPNCSMDCFFRYVGKSCSLLSHFFFHSNAHGHGTCQIVCPRVSDNYHFFAVVMDIYTKGM